jgi:hypothetical protein
MKHLIQGEIPGYLGKRLLAHQAFLQAVQLAFAQRRIARVDLLGHHAVEHCVAEEFEPFVAFEPLALMAQGLIEQLDPLEPVAEPIFEVYWPPLESAA